MVIVHLKFMLSIPRDEPMTKTESFTQWSCVLAYVVGGSTLLAAPQLWAWILQLDLEGLSEGYMRVVGIGLMDSGFILYAAARASFKMFRHQECLISIPGRLLVVNGMLLMMILRDMLPLSFALFNMVLDSSLALITLVIWRLETPGASVATFCHEISTSILRCHGPKTGGSTVVVFFLGIFQLFFWLVLAIRPDWAQRMFNLVQLEGYSSGYLAAYFFLVSIHGVYHVVGASNVNRNLSLVFVFYRISLNVPVFTVLFLVGQIERNLFIALMSFDVLFSIMIFISVKLEKLGENNADEEAEMLNN